VELSVRCSCGRVMQRSGVGREPLYRCGCRAAVTITGYAPPLNTQCPIIYEDGHRCRRPKKPGEYTCAECAFIIARATLEVPSQRQRLAKVEAFVMMEEDRSALFRADRERRDAFFDDIRQRQALIECHVVYYALIKPGVIKIGTTRNLARRMNDLRLSFSDALAAEPGDERLEKMRHHEFGDLRVRQGTRHEDFHDSDRLRAHIATLLAKYGTPSDLVHDLLTRKAAVVA